MLRPLLILVPLLSALAPAQAAQSACERSSPAHTVALVELYTSEGCNSCPPADRWLSSLLSRHDSTRVLPLSLHVDYWDYIGWSDPFAQAQFSERQRRLAGGATIYTPEVFVSARELRGWRDADNVERWLREVNGQPARAGITLAMHAGEPQSLVAEARFSLPAEAQRRSGLQGVLVLYEDGLVSSVSRGENRGVTLQHEHVVRQWLPLPLKSEPGAQVLKRTLWLAPGWKTANLGMAAFVQDLRTGEVLQAVSLPACAPAET
ncbi:conserved exported hypothetical protein [Candidatus Accumulibacter aalborgensis]|uniref:Secreted protein n=1 Tax=Candidatus Accumulibacter aalborgensis TaxID=1860102 RepID=A0A1A8XPI4_9PROT|nr:DUF1223 domain-containing protein [Candidatus Accumulibacter aalborgensis]SBT06551.1 conserved exported hypothetical protein [Candidatus Accumulibacter aalborgensis]